jgi:Ca2+-binding RTX toxin-like protein
VFGDGGRDLVSGGRGDDALVGGSGNDAVYGNQGVDELIGGVGNDTLWGLTLADVPLPGVDTLRGESGSDTFRSRDGEPDVIDCGTGSKDRALIDFVDVIVDATAVNTKGSCETVSRAAPRAKEDAPENARESPTDDGRES